MPLWTVDEVTRWVASMGFPASIIDLFRETKVDGDILLQLDDKHLENDLHMSNGIQRKRFLRELSILKKDADYSGIDGSGMAKFLVSHVGHEYKMYTYNFIRNDLTMSVMRRLGSANLNDMLIEVGIASSIHRLKIIEAIMDEGIGGSDDFNMSGSRSGSFLESPTGSQHGQVYISFNRSGRGELASLINMQLQLRGLSVQMADTLGNSVTTTDAIGRARHFVIVLGQGSLAGCKGDVKCKDPLHKEVKAALDSNCNIIPVFDNCQFPDAESLPEDMRTLCYFNGVQWVHDYQEACMDKIERFITGEGPPSRGGSLGRLAIASRLTPDSAKSTPANSLRELKNRNLSSESGIFFQT